jgi:hypothetical protein
MFFGVDGIDDECVDELELRWSERYIRRPRSFDGGMTVRGGDACMTEGVKRCAGITISNAIARTLLIYNTASGNITSVVGITH